MSHGKDYDRQIADYRNKIEELEKLKNMHHRKLEGVQRFQDMVATLVSEYGLSESEIFVSRAEAIVAWIKAAGKESGEPPLFWTQLKDYFAGIIESEKAPKRGGRKAGRGASTLKEPTLPTGVYRNPFTAEKVEKKRRNPRQLDAWVEEFGFSEVRTWIKK